MKNTQTPLVSTLDVFEENGMLKNIPSCVIENLNEKYTLRYYQESAIQRFVTYFESERNTIKKIPYHVLFHMATGSGKTMVMASCILYLYSKGYRNFLFFVNSDNILEKTKDNFINYASSKYLFKSPIKINGNITPIIPVTDFQSTNNNSINICFTTIQGLHTSLNSTSEDSIGIEDFKDKKVVLISDEAHHINMLSKKGKKDTKKEHNTFSDNWEETVINILNICKDNVLLDFTATMNISNNKAIANKYLDKTILDYTLKSFREDRFSKEVKLLKSDLDAFDRALLGIIVSQYRYKIFQKNGCPNIKPVIMMKSKTIAESKRFQEEFHAKLDNLSSNYIKKLLEKSVESDDNFIINKINKFLSINNISLENLLLELKEDFSEKHSLNVNDDKQAKYNQLLLNSLEDKNNPIRVIFCVDKLDEGWDVLNLFDIVRLFETRVVDSDKGISTATMSEAQLIGRGARYCPFLYGDNYEDISKRKFDDNLSHEMRICEEFYFHSSQDARYISELKKALQETGIIASPDERNVHLKLKKEFKDSSVYKNGYIFTNGREEIGYKNIDSLDDSITNKIYYVKINPQTMGEEYIFKDKDEVNNYNTSIRLNTMRINLPSLGKTIIRKCLMRNNVFDFDSLKKVFPELNSTSDFITSSNYLGGIKVDIDSVYSDISSLNSDEKLYIASKIISDIAVKFQNPPKRYKGTQSFIAKPIRDIVQDRSLKITPKGKNGEGIPQSETLNDWLRIDLSKKEWYIFMENYGTEEEKSFVKYFDIMYEKLSKKHKNIFLIRNEKFYELYSFDDGQRFEPDFILILQNKDNSYKHYQIFIEAKGNFLSSTDNWKQIFLKSLNQLIKLDVLVETDEFKITGLPFYTEETSSGEFDTYFKDLI